MSANGFLLHVDIHRVTVCVCLYIHRVCMSHRHMCLHIYIYIDRLGQTGVFFIAGSVKCFDLYQEIKSVYRMGNTYSPGANDDPDLW